MTARHGALLPDPAAGEIVSADALVVTSGEAAARLLHDPSFEAAWQALHQGCPWATPYQDVPFVRTWYQVYESRYAPLVIFAGDPQLDLAGLLLLAICRETGAVVHVGAHHAEYHTWLSRPADDATFILRAMGALRERRLAASLRFLFLAPGTPLDWVRGLADLRIGHMVRWHRRGLMHVGAGSGVAASLRKSSNKSRLARLRRHGEVRLEQLTTREELGVAMDAIATQCDVRQGGVHGSLPFRSDPLKRSLYLTLQAEPGLLHVTVLRAGDEMVASHIGVRAAGTLGLGLITHAPQFGACSPGKLLLLLLGQRLGEQGFEWFDLTPGGAYKDRFATHFDDVAVLDVYLSAPAHARYHARRAAVAAVRLAERWAGRDLVGLAQRTAHTGGRVLRRSPLRTLRSVARRGRRWIRSAGEFRFYEWDAGGPLAPQPGMAMRVNAIEDLLSYTPASDADPALTEFLAIAVRRLEEGQILFTAVGDGLLLHYSWVIPRTTQVGSEYGHQIVLPEPRAVLWDDFTHPMARGRGLHQASLLARLRYVAEHRLAPGALIGVRADNRPSRHNIEKTGFTYCGSAWIATRWGRARRWVSVTFASFARG